MTEEIDFTSRFEDFLNSFKTAEGETPYRKAIERLVLTKQIFIIIDFNHLLTYDPTLATATRTNPQEAIDAASEAIRRILRVVEPDYAASVERLHARFKDAPDRVSVRTIRAEHIGRLMMVDALVTRVSDVKPLLVEGFFKCRQCGDEVRLAQTGPYTVPQNCQCRGKSAFELIPERSKFVDWQKIRLQEKPEELPPGTLPRALDCILLEDLVDVARPGDPCRVVGILRSTQDYLALVRRKASTFSVSLATNYVDVSERESDRVEITPKEEEEIRKLADDPLIHRKIVNSIAPSIYGLTDVKEAVALLLFGGVSKTLADGMKIRGDSNILIVGDPGTAKSVVGTEQLYVGRLDETRIKWVEQAIGVLVDGLMLAHPHEVLHQGDAEILRVNGENPIYTQSLDPLSLRVCQSRILEVSRHHASQLVRIRTRSGRTVLATPDHSFTTLVDGHLRVITARDLQPGVYLPVARFVRLDEEYAPIDLASQFPEAELVSTEVIGTQIELVNAGLSSAHAAALTANITPNTFGEIVHGGTIPEGSWLRRKRDTSWFPRWLDLEPALGRIIGLYLAEGNVEGNTIRFTSLDKSIRGFLKRDLEAVFGNASMIKIGALLCQASLAGWFKQAFGTGAANKRVPTGIFTAPQSFRSSVLSAYFAGDGTVAKHGAAVTATTVSQSLAYQLSDLLATLGIFATIRVRTITKGPYRGCTYYKLQVQGTDVIAFLERIGFASASKQNDLKRLVARLNSRRRYQSRDIIPNFGPLLIHVSRELGIRGPRGSWTRSFLAELRGKTQRQRIGRRYLQRVLSRLEQLKPANQESPNFDFLRTLANSDVFWDAVAQVEFLDKPAIVYDIGAAEGHFVLARGNLIVHNSQLLRYVASIAPRGLYTSGKGSTAAGLCVAADSKVLFQSGPQAISEVVENQFQGRDCVEYGDGVWFVKNGVDDLRVLHSRDLRIDSGEINRLWKIKSPEALVHLRTQTGRELELTAQTRLLSVDKRLGLVWKPASMLSTGDRVATVRTLRLNRTREIPSVFNLIKDYPNDLLLLGLKNEVSLVISKITRRLGVTKRRLAKMLNVSEDSIYRWMNERRVGNISLTHFIALCTILEEDAEAHLPQEFTIQVIRGASIRFPRRFGQELLYILGLIAGDGRISIDRRKPEGHESVTIGLSNREPYLLSRFSAFFKRLGLKVIYSPGSADRAPEVRISSSLIFHMISKFGLRCSPKSNTISPSPDLICTPEKHLSSFIRGLFDSDGWFSTRKDEKSGSCQLGFSSTSLHLASFVRDALSTKGIVVFLRERPPSGGITRNGRLIKGKHVRYELSVSNYADICAFAQHFGFETPSTRRNLISYCNKPRKHHRNIDNIPDVSAILSRLMTFYDSRVFEIDGKNVKFPPTRINHTMYTQTFPKIVAQLCPDVRKHRVVAPFAWRNRLFRESENALHSNELSKRVSLPRARAYEYFLRKRGTPRIPLHVIQQLMSLAQGQLSRGTREYWSNVIETVLIQHRKHRQDYQFLRSLSNPDIFWDKVLEAEQRQALNPFVYDLTVAGTHNFIVNGFVVHNTAAVMRDPDTQGFTLEAGALVLADRGTACLHPKAVVIADNALVTIESLFEKVSRFRAVSNGETVEVGELRVEVPSLSADLDVALATTSCIRKRNGPRTMIRLSTASGFETVVTPDHRLIDGNSLGWKEAQHFKVGDAVLAPLKYPGHDNPICILDIMPDEWMVYLDKGEKAELRQALLNKFPSLAAISRCFGLRRDVLSGSSQMSVEKLRRILTYLGALESWKTRPLTFGRLASGEQLRVTTLTPALAYFLGFAYGDGHVRTSKRRSSITISQSLANSKQIARLTDCFSQFSNHPLARFTRTTRSEIRGKPVQSHDVVLCTSSNLLAYIYGYITRNSLGQILRLPDESLRAFLAGVIDSDGCLSVKRCVKDKHEYNAVHIDIQCSNNLCDNQALLHALRRFDCHCRIKPGRGVLHISVTGSKDVDVLIEAIRPYSVKVHHVPQMRRWVASLSERVPSEPVTYLCNELSELSTPLLLERGLWSTIQAYKNHRYQPSRGQLRRIQARLANQLAAPQQRLLNVLLRRDYFLDPIVAVEQIPYDGPVYDLHVQNTHNFCADGLFTHNCIDEFDKMNPQDRTAIHEAMEQHSYHPDTEILATNGTRIKMGPFVDGLMAEHQDQVIHGVDCEILRFDGLEVYTTDFKNIVKAKVDRVSRHLAPDQFFRLTFANGRSVMVTPEHPVFVFRDGAMSCVAASECRVNDFAPVPGQLPNSCNPVILARSLGRVDARSKVIDFPSILTPALARILGYFVTESHSFRGSTAEIGFSNMDARLLEEVEEAILSVFGIAPTTSHRSDGLITLRYLSVELYKWLSLNFPEAMVKSKFKRIPAKILGASVGIAREFLASAFRGVGSVESTAVCFRTASTGLSHDYQDLLLKLRIQTRIVHDRHNDSYKVYVRGQSLITLFNDVLDETDPRYDRIRGLIRPEQDKIHHHDVFPTSIIYEIIGMKRDLGIAYDGYFHRHLNANHGVTRNILENELAILSSKYGCIKDYLRKSLDVADLRKKCSYSQAVLASIAGLTRGTIDYYERGGYDQETRHGIKVKVFATLDEKLEEIRERLAKLCQLKDADVLWNRIKNIEVIENADPQFTPYVYDITVEPNHAFVGQGVVLHNTVSIAKAGIVATLNARTAILAAANPTLGRYVPERSFAENVNLPVTLLSRFDLIFTLTDQPEAERDEQMAEHIISLHRRKGTSKEPPIAADMLRKYIAYARRTVTPRVTDEALKVVKEYYLGMRKAGELENAPVPITPRQLESLIRLAEAHAKMALHATAVAEDAQAAVRLVQVSLQQVGIDRETGQYDIDNIMIGRGKSQRDKLQTLLTMLRDLEKEIGGPVPIEKLEKRAELEGMSAEFVKQAVQQLRDKDGVIFEPRPGHLKYIRGA